MGKPTSEHEQTVVGMVDWEPGQLSRWVQSGDQVPVTNTLAVDPHAVARAVRLDTLAYHEEGHGLSDCMVLSGQSEWTVARWLGVPMRSQTYRTLAESDQQARLLHYRLIAQDEARPDRTAV